MLQITRLTLFLTGLLLLVSDAAFAQKVYTIDASTMAPAPVTDIRLGSPGPAGKEIRVNSQYMTIGGKIVLPVMGEMHFARVPRANWEDVILKMKANGVNIIASYIFWIHHEEIAGKFVWEGNKDLRAFAKLCQKHNLYFYPRVGPYCHGEARNGGIPDWVLLKKDVQIRSNNAPYQQYVDQWFAQIGRQLSGLTYKEGGPVIGIQLENEFVSGQAGEAHILWLKKTAIHYGLDVPLYTVTGWGSASIPDREVIPLFGAYPDEPWMDDLERTTACTNFGFSAIRNDAKIGNALQQSEQEKRLVAYPYFTCEMGVGIDNTAHRRLLIGKRDGYTLINAKLGSGSNLIGYYMFAGGLNPTGVLTSMEENGPDGGAYNTNPAIAYDFQAAIGKTGALAGSYNEIKKTHYFLNEFGPRLAPMRPVLANTGDDLQLAVRANGNQAFLFGINYCRHNARPALKGVQFTVKLKDDTITFPSQPVTIPDSSVLIWPINFPMGTMRLRYATAQPLCELNGKWVFIQSLPNEPEFCFDAAGISKLTSNTGVVSKKDGRYIVSGLKPGYNAVISLTPTQGPPQTVIVLSAAEASQAWLLTEPDRKRFYLSNANLYIKGNTLHSYGLPNQVVIKELGSEDLKPASSLKLNTRQQGLFTTSTYTIPPQQLNVACRPRTALGNSQWLLVNKLEKLTPKQVLHHHFFQKEFTYNQSSGVKRARLLLATESDCRVQVNTVWVHQPVVAGQLNELDLTGYLQPGANRLLLEFPFTEGRKAFSATLIIESHTNNRVEIVTDSSWRMRSDSYTFPSRLTGGYPDEKVEGVVGPVTMDKPLPDVQEYSLTVPDHGKELSNVYLNIAYTGDRGRLYWKNRLIDDNFNNNTPWSIGLNRYEGLPIGEPLTLQLYPLKKDARVYFDVPIAQGDNQKPVVRSIQAVPEYQADFRLQGQKSN